MNAENEYRISHTAAKNKLYPLVNLSTYLLLPTCLCQLVNSSTYQLVNILTYQLFPLSPPSRDSESWVNARLDDRLSPIYVAWINTFFP